MDERTAKAMQAHAKRVADAVEGQSDTLREVLERLTRIEALLTDPNPAPAKKASKP